MTWRARENQAKSEERRLIAKTIFIKDLKAKDTVLSTFLVRSKELPLNKNGKAYLALNLGDNSGEIDSRLWDNVESVASSFEPGDIIAVGGKVNCYQNRLQLIIQHLTPVPPQEISLDDFLPKGPDNLESLYEELVEVFRGLKDPHIRQVALSLLEDPEIATRYKVCPAAKTIHHAFIGGLLVHSLQLIKLVDAILPLYTNINRDLLIFGAAFHDFGKIYELSYDGSFGYTDEGRLVGHITIGAVLVDRKIQAIPGFPKALEWQLKHLILSHHGELEYGSPKRPHTLEAQILHHLDNMDSKINSIQTFIESQKGASRWTPMHRAYDQCYFRPDVHLLQ